MKKNAFTLAEVLITLGIIGVVAALVMPSMISNVQDKILRAQRLKIINVLANGLKMAEAQADGSKEGTPLAKCSDLYYDPFSPQLYTCEYDAIRETFQPLYTSDANPNQMGGKITYSVIYGGDPLEVDWSDPMSSGACPAFATKDGVFVSLCPTPSGSDNGAYIFVDVNGKKKPNVAGKDFFWGAYDLNATVVLAIPGPDQTECENIKNATWDNNACIVMQEY